MECKIKSISINYEVIGQGKPIVMIHGYTPDHRLMSGCMEPVFKEKTNYKRIYFDLPGMGKTSAVDWITNSDVMLDIILEFIDHVIPNGNFLLAGESYGGYLSRGILKKIPHRVDGLLMICPCIIPDSSKRRLPPRKVLLENDRLLSQLAPYEVEQYASIAVVQSEETWQRFRDEILPGLELADKSFLANFRETGYAFSFDVDETGSTFDKPALILAGRQDDSVGYKDAWDLLDRYPRAAFAVLDRAGHNLQIEQPEVFSCLVREWLYRVEEYLANPSNIL
ncbi:MAG: alpha/beta fold hydrolase [Bacillota bacterium]